MCSQAEKLGLPHGSWHLSRWNLKHKKYFLPLLYILVYTKNRTGLDNSFSILGGASFIFKGSPISFFPYCHQMQAGTILHFSSWLANPPFLSEQTKIDVSLWHSPSDAPRDGKISTVGQLSWSVKGDGGLCLPALHKDHILSIAENPFWIDCSVFELPALPVISLDRDYL